MIQFKCDYSTTDLKSRAKVDINDLTGIGQRVSRWSQVDAILNRYMNQKIRQKIRQILDGTNMNLHASELSGM